MTFNPRHGQLPPEWGIWGMSAGRGAGKTEAAIRWFDKCMSTNEGFRGLIVVPHPGDIQIMIERFQAVNDQIIAQPNIRRLTWTAPTSMKTLRLEEAREGLARVQDLPVSHRIRRWAETELTEATREVNGAGSQAFITSSEAASSIRGVQAHISFLDNIHLFSNDAIDDYDGQVGLQAIDRARIAARDRRVRSGNFVGPVNTN